MVQVLADEAPAPRLCHLIKWPDFDGYGFNLHAERSNPGQYIGKIDQDSPAQSAGLREGDRIIEVNGVNISNENHRQVVERIKSNPSEAKLLVVDAEADLWYRERDLAVKSSQLNLVYMRTQVPRPETSSSGGEPDAGQSSEPTSGDLGGDLDDDSIEQQAAGRSPAPMSPDSGRGMDDAVEQLQQPPPPPPPLPPQLHSSRPLELAAEELVVEAEINMQTAAISELSRKHKQLVVEEVKQKLRRHEQAAPDQQQQQQAQEQPNSMQPDSLSDDAKEQARQKHNGSADSGKPTDSASSRSESIADSLEDTLERTEASAVEEDQIKAVNEQEATKASVEKVTNNNNNNEDENQVHEKTRQNSDQAEKETPIEQLTGESVAVASGEQVEQSHESIQKKEEEKEKRETIATSKMTQATSVTQQTPQSKTVLGSDAPAAKSPLVMQQQQQINNNNLSGLNLNMTASEMRELIASRKKFDPKKAQMNIRQKYEIIQQM